eukprot:gene89-117_t
MTDDEFDILGNSLSLQDALAESIPFLLVDDLVRSRKITGAEADFLRKKYCTHYAAKKYFENKDLSLSKRSRGLANEIVSEKILVEKNRLQEYECNQNVRSLEEQRDTALNELEFVELKQTMSKFELTEIRKLHEELSESLVILEKENKDVVEPAIEKLKQEAGLFIATANIQLENADLMYQKEEQDKKDVLRRMSELEEHLAAKKVEFETIMAAVEVTKLQPQRLTRKSEAISKAATHLEEELLRIHGRTRRHENELTKQVKRRDDAEKLKIHLEEQLEMHNQTLETRENDLAILKKKVEVEQASHHDLVTKKVALNIRKREVEGVLRFRDDQLNFLQREYEGSKRLYKKKVGIVDATKALLPELELQLVDADLALQNFKKESEAKKARCADLKDVMESDMARFLSQVAFEKGEKQALEDLLSAVEEAEAEAMRLMAEDKRLAKLQRLLSSQRDTSTGEVTRLQHKEKDARQHIRLKELIILDLTKRCNEISNRLKEFSALYEVVKNERNKYCALIQSSEQALAEMREKIKILSNEIEILMGECAGKAVSLQKEHSSHRSAQSHRDKLRQDMNGLLSDYRQKQATVELQIQDIDKQNVVINALEKEMIRIKSAFEKAADERNSIGTQLIDRNDELCIIHERWRQQKDALAAGEETLVRKEEEMRMLRLQSEELKRCYRTATCRLPEVERHRARLKELEQELKDEKRIIFESSGKLEDPQNTDRWRAIEGEDPSLEQLTAKVAVLENRLDAKREQFLEKGLSLEEIALLTEKLRSKALGRRDAARGMADNLNDLQSRIRDATKKMLASVSELSMYQATALRLQQEKINRTKELEAAQFRFDHGEPPNDEAIRELARSERRRMQLTESMLKRDEEIPMNSPISMKKTTVEPRPTAYIPDDIGLPRPYGAHPPFKPGESTAALRAIRQPQPKPIEI